MSAEDQPLWMDMLKAKYFPSLSPMFAVPRGGSQFWKSLVKVRPIFQSFVKFVVGDGSSIRFWLDWWCGDSPLTVTFISPRSGRLAFPQRSKSSCGKISGVGCPRLIKFEREMAQALSSVPSTVMLRTRSIFSSIVTWLSSSGAACGSG